MTAHVANLTNILFCLNCKRDEAQFFLKREGFICENCEYIYPLIDQIVIAFSKDGEKVTREDDWAGQNPNNVLAMKEYAYFSDGFIPRLYQHYHRYISDYRSNLNFKEWFIDVGCGFGEHSRFIDKEEKGYYIGADVDRHKLEFFRSRDPEVCLVQCDAKELPFKGASCNLVQTTAFLEHFDQKDIKEILTGIKRVLKKGGNYINAIPTEGGCLLGLGQKFMELYFKMRFEISLQHEEQHKSDAKEILAQVRSEFMLLENYFFPFSIPYIDLNLFVTEIYKNK
jgi:ubiquinone/menaquinone biosynthesis C-methylase UbiE